MRNLIYIILLFTGIVNAQFNNMLLASQAQFANETTTGDASTANVRLVVKNSASLTTADTSVKGYLDAYVGTVQVTDPSGMGSITNHDFTVIAESIISGDVSSLEFETKPIITLEGSNWDEFNLGLAGTSDDGLTTAVLANSHVILDGVTFPLSVNISGAEDQGSINIDADATATAYLLKSDAHTITYNVIAFDKGETLGDSSVADDKRIFMAGLNADLWSTGYQTIFTNALDWCMTP